MGARLRPLAGLALPAALVVVSALVGSRLSPSLEFQVRYALVLVAICAALWTFIGTSGVISFGHVGFVSVGAFAAGLATVPPELKSSTLPDLFPFVADLALGDVASLVLAAVLGLVYAAVFGVALMRLNGLAAGIATFAMLEITNNVLRNWTKIGPGPQTLALVPETTDMRRAAIGALLVIAVAWAYAGSRFGRRLAASREDQPAARSAGIDVYRERVVAFALSGLLAGFAGGLFSHLFGDVQADRLYLELTFLTLAMLVVGGLSTLTGAVVGALALSFLNSFLAEAEKGLDIGLDLPDGSRSVLLALVLVLVLLLRPGGLVTLLGWLDGTRRAHRTPR